MSLPFRQVNVFSSAPTGGNPVAVVHDADGLSDDQMAAFARWTNLSETTFLLTPTDEGRAAGADYRVRIWTPGGELPFAGHPTLGTAHAWLEAGGVLGGRDVIQECGVGLVRLRRAGGDQSCSEGGSEGGGEGGQDSGADGRGSRASGGDRQRLAFAGPPLLRSGPVDDADLAQLARALRIDASDIVRSAWVDNGPGWVAAQLRDAEAVLALDPDPVAMGDLKVGVVGEYRSAPVRPADPARPADPTAPAVEVRAFVPSIGVGEDPVTGSLNAGLGQWLAGEVLPTSYVASQGTVLGRAGRVLVEKLPGGEVWVGGDTVTTIAGHVELGRSEV